MASYPRGDEINTLLAISVDIKAGRRLVVARPALVRVPDDAGPYISTVYGQSTPLYSVVKRIFKDCVEFNSNRFEIVPAAQIDEENEERVKAALESLRRKPNEPDRAEKN
jgi:hypothetical protein